MPPATTSADRLREADERFSARKYGEARALYAETAEAALAEGAPSVAVEALAQVARCWSLPSGEGAPDLARAREALGRAKAHAGDPPGWTRYLGVRGILEREEGDRPRALATFVEMHDYARANDLPRRAIDAAHHAAIVSPVDQQEAWALKGIAAAEAAKDTGWLAVLWNNLGATFEDQQRYPDAVRAYERAREYHHQGQRELPKLAADWALGHALRLAGDLAAAERWLVPAQAWAERRHAASPSRETHEWMGYTNQDLGELEVAQGRRADGRERLRKARAHLVESGIERFWPEGLRKLDERLAALADPA